MANYIEQVQTADGTVFDIRALAISAVSNNLKTINGQTLIKSGSATNIQLATPAQLVTATSGLASLTQLSTATSSLALQSELNQYLKLNNGFNNATVTAGHFWVNANSLAFNAQDGQVYIGGGGTTGIVFDGTYIEVGGQETQTIDVGGQGIEQINLDAGNDGTINVGGQETYDISIECNDTIYIGDEGQPTVMIGSSGAVELNGAVYLNGDAFATVATSGDYNDLTNLPTIPTVYNGSLTITRNNTAVGTFYANQSTDTTLNISVTDSKVQQQNTTSDSNLRIILSYGANNTTVTNEVWKSESLIFNPSTKILTVAGTVSANTVLIGGNAAVTTVALAAATNGLAAETYVQNAVSSATNSLVTIIALTAATTDLTTHAEVSAATSLLALATEVPAAANNGALTIRQNGSAVGTFYANQSTDTTLDFIITTTDNKVSQTNTTASNNYRILLSNTASDATETAGAWKSGNLTYNPAKNEFKTVGIVATGTKVILGDDSTVYLQIDEQNIELNAVLGTYNGSEIATQSWVESQEYALASNLATVATTGNYNDLDNRLIAYVAGSTLVIESVSLYESAESQVG